MSAKWSILDIAAANFKTYQNARNGQPKLSDYAAFIGLPTALAALAGYSAHAKHFELMNASQFIGGVGIFTGLLFGLLTNVFTLSLRVRRDEGLDATHPIIAQVRELFANVGWAVLVGLSLIISIVVASATHDSKTPLEPPWVAALAFLFFHLMMTVLMSLKRLWFAHENISKLPPKRKP